MFVLLPWDQSSNLPELHYLFENDVFHVNIVLVILINGMECITS
uniref:Uncharacterized protein n=1 Tax=Arundo donax TaxID=35708 RepID=A0A0A9GC35_ARUDO